jgi:glutathione synthase/RimK-type ligase-like ATP-grasp enzyme
MSVLRYATRLFFKIILLTRVLQMYGGLDMCAMDVLRTADGEDIILELNDTACGLPFEFEPQDSVIIRDMVLERMNKLFCQ